MAIIRTVKDLREILQYVDGDARVHFMVPPGNARGVEITVSNTRLDIWGADGRKNYTTKEIEQSIKATIARLQGKPEATSETNTD